MKIFYTNADQFPNKRDELLMIIAGNEPDIILITETIPKAQLLPLPEARIAIPGFTPHYNFTPSLPDLGSSGVRGISVHVATSIKVSEIKIQDSDFSEQLWLEVKLKGRDK